MICPNCGSENKDDVNQCSFCGQRLAPKNGSGAENAYDWSNQTNGNQNFNGQPNQNQYRNSYQDSNQYQNPYQNQSPYGQPSIPESAKGFQWSCDYIHGACTCQYYLKLLYSISFCAYGHCGDYFRYLLTC